MLAVVVAAVPTMVTVQVVQVAVQVVATAVPLNLAKVAALAVR